MNKIPRRRFIRNSLLAAAAFKAWPLVAQTSTQSRIIGANGDIRYAVVGFNGRGKNHIEALSKVKGARLAALCDVDSAVLETELKKAAEGGAKVEGYTDIRKLLENKDVDAVTFATPNHWHALGAIWAVQAGKDVYVEKPASHNVWEGRKMVEAARKYNRIVQVGTQCRSSVGLQEAIAWLREGQLGKIIRARGLCYKRRESIGKTSGPQPVPATVNYDLWCGPAPLDPPRRNSKKNGTVHYDWHWFWPYGNGDLGNQGIHQVDIARWVLGEPEISPRVLSLGGRLGYEDDGITPNTQIVFHDYKAAPLIFEVRGLPASVDSSNMDEYHGASIGVVVDCEGGSMVIPSYTKAIIYDKAGKEIKTYEEGGDHFENFIHAVRSRKATDLHADILEGHISAALMHTGNISYRLGKPMSSEAIHDAAKTNGDLAESLGRMEEHLGANQVDLHKTPLMLGEVLKINPKTEHFTNNKEANQLLTREYRKPFVVPEKV
ncbi:MAG TPA: Gfo/Idh/MocA family oxidoreductase [Verrucomicrobiae bacterium]|nr:Gfo/Idh/MocA family oxidoreductase [Verrucomicrobiae bacterium]